MSIVMTGIVVIEELSSHVIDYAFDMEKRERNSSTTMIVS